MTKEKQIKAIELDNAIRWYKKIINELEIIMPKEYLQKDAIKIKLETYPDGHAKVFDVSLFDLIEGCGQTDKKIEFKYLSKDILPDIINATSKYQKDLLKTFKNALADLELQYDML